MTDSAAKQAMLAGQMYRADDPQLVAERRRMHAACRCFNAEVDLDQSAQLQLQQHFAAAGTGVWIESPFFCDYGGQISLGERVYANAGVTILDCAAVVIGDDVKFGPGVQIYTAGHALEPGARAAGDEFALPVIIGDRVWIGGSAVILPGVTIGAESVIGAGSVVTKSIPAGVIAAGNPARVIRPVPTQHHDQP